jgi:hypothetical protein
MRAISNMPAGLPVWSPSGPPSALMLWIQRRPSRLSRKAIPALFKACPVVSSVSFV